MTASVPRPSMAGRDAGVTEPTASEYFRYVSIEATTTRASTVMRSMPTSDTRTHASMTMPLSSTRSRTSIRLDPPAARSTAILIHLLSAIQALGAQARRAGGGAGRGFQLALQAADLLAQRLVFGGKRSIAH